MTTVITTRTLTERYGKVRAVDGIDLDVRAGDVYGFIGANGSGKTTTVRMLLGLVLPTSGADGHPGRRSRPRKVGAAGATGGAHRADRIDPAEVNARLVAAGVPVTGLALERPTLEEVVLAAASATPDRVDAR